MSDEQDTVKRVGNCGECIIWPGPTFDKAGYGDRGAKTAKRDGLSRKAHRAVYEVVYGHIPDGYVVRHSCDNPSCINPLHLVAGTKADNSYDAVLRDRTRFGVDHHAAVLNDRTAREIAERLCLGERAVDLAREFGVTRGTVHSLRRRETWVRVTADLDLPESASRRPASARRATIATHE